MDSTVAALLGTLLGSVITAVVAFVNAHRQRRTEIDSRVIAAAFDFAALEWRGHLDKSFHQGGGATLPPSIYLIEALAIAQVIADKRPLNAAFLEGLYERMNDLGAEFARIDARRRTNRVENSHPNSHANSSSK